MNVISSFNNHIVLKFLLNLHLRICLLILGGEGEREREREREKETKRDRDRQTHINVKEKHLLVASHSFPDWGLNPQITEKPAQGIVSKF